MDFASFLQKYNYLIYSVLIAIIIYLIYQISYKDYSMPIEYFDVIERPSPPLILINIKNFRFNPEYIIVPISTEIRWINFDTHSHGVSENNKLFQSPNLALNQSFSFKFTQPGTYYYHCPYYHQ